MKEICQNFGTELGSFEYPFAPSDLSDSEWRLLSLAEIAYSG